MKTPEEVKKGLKCCRDNVPCIRCEYYKNRDHRYTCQTDLFADVIAYIERLEAQVPKWISVEERLPEDNNNVLVYAIGNNENSIIAMTDYTHNMYGYNIEGWHSPWQYFFYEYKITHWMPLPEAPKEG